MRYTNKLVEVLNNVNTFTIKNEKELEIARGIFNMVALDLFKDITFEELQKLFNVEVLIVEYQLGKGFTSGWTFEESETWYGKKPYTFNEVYETYDDFKK